ncbi:MAG: hypothetical protein EBT12_00230 [Marivivens sp.]|nr:hypothetical protein [Marivivens sp.]
MALDVRIVDGAGGRGKGALDLGGGLTVTMNPYPAHSDVDITKIYRENLKNSAGSEDMRVDGSTTPVEFSVSADPEVDIFITTVSFLISDAGATLKDFGALAELTNGCDFYYSNSQGEVNIATGLKTNFSLIRLCSGLPSFGDGANAFRGANVTGTAEAFFPIFSFQTFGLPFGVRLAAGSVQKIGFRVNDDLSTGLEAFDAICYGFERKLK